MNKTVFSILLFFVFVPIKAQIPDGYYDDAEGKTGYELKTALKTIITDGHVDQGYDDLYILYESSDNDVYYENDNTVLDMYSEKPAGTDSYEYVHNDDKCGNYDSEADCYNREHLMPQSVFDSESPMKNDGHFVVPSDGYVNGKRSSYAFGIVGDATWTSTNGSKLGDNATAGYSGTVFEPIDEFKGDIARMLFYFATRYEDQVADWSHDMLNGTSDQVYADWFLDILLQWDEDDPVSQREIDRNEAVYDYQGNRNPFIDHPEWVNDIWGSANNDDSSSDDNNDGSSDGSTASGDIIAIQDFEGTSPQWNYTEFDGGNSCFSTGTDYQNNSTNSLQIKGTDEQNVDPYIELSNIDISTYSNVKLWIYFAANGPDSGDDLWIDISYDDGTSWTSTKLVDGYSNANLNFGDTNASDPTTVSPNPYSIDIADSETQIKVRVRFDENSGKNNTGDYYYVDDIKLEGETTSTDEVDWGNIQYPEDGDVNTGDSFTVYAQVYEPGVTDASGQGNGITVWIGYSAVDNDPTDSANDGDWTWEEAVYNTDSGDNDEYMLDLESKITSGGTYYYASRFQLNGGPFKYGGYNGGFWDNTYSAGTGNKSGRLILNNIDWCNLQHPEEGTIFEGDSFVVYAQIYEPGITEADGQGANISAWIGYSQVDNDPADIANAGDWTWVSAIYNTDSGNNDEYTADLGNEINSGGTYYYASRFQLFNGDYFYGGYDGGFWSNTYGSGTGNKSGRLIVNGITIANVVQTPTDVYDTDSVNISADITASTGVSGVELHWGTTSGDLSNTIDMSNSSGDTYVTNSDIPSQSEGTTVYYEIYVLDSDANEKTSTEYSYTVNAGTSPCATELIISEYIEGSGNNKFLELYNGTGSSIDLSNYEIRQYNNGSSSVTYTLTLSGSLADGATYVIENSSEDLGVAADLSTSSSVMQFNGDDALELYNTTTGSSVDIIGKIGEDPGSAWGSDPTSTGEHTLVRKSDISQGDTDGTDAFDPADEWIGYEQDDVSHLGTHTMNCVDCEAPVTDAVFDTDSPQNITGTSVKLTWVNGSGDNRIVIIRDGAEVTFIPTDDTTYVANSSYGTGTDVSGNGEYIIYNGEEASVDISNLVAGHTYFVKIYEYNCTAGNEKYYTSGTPASDFFITTPNNPDNFSVGECITNSTINLSWSAPVNSKFDGYVLVIREGTNAPHTVDSVSPETISGANTYYPDADEYGSTTPYSRYLYVGTDTSATITGLTEGTTYTFKIYAYVTDSGDYQYSSGTQTTQTIDLNQVSSAHATPANAKATVFWINPENCFDEILVVANETEGIDFTPAGDGTAYTANSDYAGSNQVVYKGVDNSVTVTSLTNETTYYFEIFVRKDTEWSNGIEVSVTPRLGTEFQSGQLIFVAYDGQINGSGADDEYLIATLVDIEPGTTFLLVNSRYEAGAPANERTNKWGGAGDDASVNPGVAEITYVGTSAIPAGSILKLDTDYSADFLTYVGVITSTTETDQTADFSVTVLYGEESIPNISASSPDQIFLAQGVFVYDGTDDPNEANYILEGRLLHGITNRIPWVSLSDACSGSDTRESRLHPALNCFNIENSDTSAISGFYQNDDLHDGSFRDIILAVSNSANWTLGTDRYILDPTTTNETDTGHTFTISGSHTPGTWVSSADTNWFNCSNWETLTVPDAATDVYIDVNSSVNAVVNATAPYADLFSGIAECNNLEISNMNLVVEGDQDLIIHGNLTIDSEGTLDADDGDDTTPDGNIFVQGNWTNADKANFIEGNSTVIFNGDEPQTVTCNDSDTEEFYNLTIDNSEGVVFTSGNIHAANDLTIENSPSINITDGHYLLAGNSLVNNTDITIENQGSLVQTEPVTNNENISGTGSFTMNKTSLPMSHYYDYVYWSSPIYATDLNFAEVVADAWRYYAFDPAYQPNATYPGWVYKEDTDTFVVGEGYAISAPTNQADNTALSVSFYKNAAPFNNGQKDIALKIYDDNNGADGDDDFNLIGNPYPSAIDFNVFATENTNIQGAYYAWTNCMDLDADGHHQDAGYAVYSAGADGVSTQSACGGNGVAAEQYIASGQAIMVEAINTGTISFKNSYRVLYNNDNFINRPAQSYDRIWLNLTNDTGAFNQIAIGFYDDATNDYDRMFDAYALDNGYGQNFYSLSADTKLNIQGLSSLQDEEREVPIGYSVDEEGVINIHINKIEGILNDYNIYLKDAELNLIHNLKEADYVTTSVSGVFDDRFILLFSPQVTNVEENMVDPNAILLIKKDNGLFTLLTTQNTLIDAVRVYDLSGKLLFNQSGINKLSYKLNLSSVANGNILFFRITLADGSVHIKKTIK